MTAIQKIENYLNGLIPRLEHIGCKGIVFGSGYARRLPDGVNSTYGDYCMQKLIVDILLPKLEKGRMKILIEPLHPDLCNYLNAIDHAVKLCKMCDSPYVGIVADSYNLMYNEKTPEQIEKYAHYIWHVHLSEHERKCPGNNPSEDFMKFILALRKAKYKGSISFECQMSDYREYQKIKKCVKGYLKTYSLLCTLRKESEYEKKICNSRCQFTCIKHVYSANGSKSGAW